MEFLFLSRRFSIGYSRTSLKQEIFAKKKVLPQNAQNLQLKELSFFVAARVNKKNVICKK